MSAFSIGCRQGNAEFRLPPPDLQKGILTVMSTMPEIDDTTTPVITILAKFAHELTRELLDFASENPNGMRLFVVAKWEGKEFTLYSSNQFKILCATIETVNVADRTYCIHVSTDALHEVKKLFANATLKMAARLVFKGDELYLQHEDTEINLTGHYPGVSADEVAEKMETCFDEVVEHTKDSETVLVNLDHMVKTDRNAHVTVWSCIGDNGKPYSGFTYKSKHPILKNARTNTHLAAIFTANKAPR